MRLVTDATRLTVITLGIVAAMSILGYCVLAHRDFDWTALGTWAQACVLLGAAVVAYRQWADFRDATAVSNTVVYLGKYWDSTMPSLFVGVAQATGIYVSTEDCQNKGQELLSWVELRRTSTKLPQSLLDALVDVNNYFDRAHTLYKRDIIRRDIFLEDLHIAILHCYFGLGPCIRVLLSERNDSLRALAIDAQRYYRATGGTNAIFRDTVI